MVSSTGFDPGDRSSTLLPPARVSSCVHNRRNQQSFFFPVHFLEEFEKASRNIAL